MPSALHYDLSLTILHMTSLEHLYTPSYQARLSAASSQDLPGILVYRDSLPFLTWRDTDETKLANPVPKKLVMQVG